MSALPGSLAVVLALAGCAAAPPATTESAAPAPSSRPVEVAIAPAPPAEVPAVPVAAPAATSAAPAVAAATAVAGAYTVEVGSAKVNGGTRTVLRVAAPCAAGRCDRAPFDLGWVSSVRKAGLVDLLGPSVRVQHQDMFGGDGLPSSLPASAGFPAAVLVVDDPLGTRLVILSLRDDPPVQILSVALAESRPGGGGFSTINAVELTQAGAGPLEVHFAQTSLPGPGARPYRPGPPLRFRYRFDGASYKRE
jgi:hypothetical protein